MTMADFHQKGSAPIEFFDLQIALEAWDELDQHGLHKVIGIKCDTSWYPLEPPLTRKFRTFAREIEKVSIDLLPTMPQILTSGTCLSAGSVTAKSR